jgi:hypothetical protein
MSTLTQLLYIERFPNQLADQGGQKIPIVIPHQISPEFEDVYISLREGDIQNISVPNDGMIMSAFFQLDLEEEDQYMARMLQAIRENASSMGWTNIAEAVPPDALIPVTADYMDGYDLFPAKVFVGVLGYVWIEDMVDTVVPTKKEEITITKLSEWMARYACIGTFHGLPVFFNPHIQDTITITAPSETLGSIVRIGDYVSVMLHNAERSLVSFYIPGKAS